MRNAYLVIVHSHPAYVLELFRYIYNGRDIYIFHVDAKAPLPLRQLVSELSFNHDNVFGLSSLCSWGGFSLVDAELRGMRKALEVSRTWEHFVVLSEYHLPLHSPDTLSRMLEIGRSYLTAHPVSALSEPSKTAVVHRTAMEYRELPGVGVFGVAPRDLGTQFYEELRHGSQWIILSRQACQLISDSADSPFWQPFRTSLLPDENAIQTFMANQGASAGLPIDYRETTFVAWPHISGTSDMTFREADFHAARDQDYFFIRKRPPDLPPSVVAILERGALIDSVPATLLGCTPQDNIRALGPIVSALEQCVCSAFPSARVRVHQTSPHLHVIVRSDELPSELSVHVLSYDLHDAQVVLSWARPYDGDFSLINLGRYPSRVIQARIYGLFLSRQVFIDTDPAHGVHKLSGPDSIIRTAESVIIHLRSASELLDIT